MMLMRILFNELVDLLTSLLQKSGNNNNNDDDDDGSSSRGETSSFIVVIVDDIGCEWASLLKTCLFLPQHLYNEYTHVDVLY